MTCWSNADIAFMGQFFFIGLTIGLVNISFPERFGRKKVLVLFLGPITMIGFSLCLYLNSYICMCIGYMFLGFSKGKTTICLLYANEQIQSHQAPYASSIIYFLDSGCTALFCLWMLLVNRDAI